MATARKILQEQFHDSCSHLDKVLAGIQEDEFFWEPVAHCWTVHDRSERRAAHADGAGRWVIDYEIPEPSPAPVTTIAWRTVHIGAVNYLYWDYAFGPATASFDLEMPGDADTAIVWLQASQRPLVEALSNLPTDDALDDQVPTNWGELMPVSRIFTTLVNEQVHHGAEISLLRDLYRNRETLGTARS
ncbi:DinB family protein [Kribbella sancticallisti]|uniref:DinB family protein n=1 Tax=Kribbella sancticallisti TaxID=460087 RepID=A0ABN2DPK8_9ACTN